MRRSLATWVLVAATAALICLPSGCIGSRMGRKPAGDKWSMFSWGKKKPSTELAQNKPTPPSSNIAPGTNLASAPANNSSQPFPSQPASGSGGVPASYASTGASAYGPASAQGGYGSPSGQDNYVATSGGAAPQRGFYGDEYQGGGQADSRSQYSQAPAGGNYGGGYSDTGSSGGYQDSYGGSQQQGQGYEQVADQRNAYGGSSYDGQYQGGGDSRYVSPAGGEQYDSRNPAPSQYNDGYGSQYQGTSADSGYGSNQYSGGNYSNTQSQGGSYGGAPVQSTNGARQYLPGSTKPYNQQQLNPPTTGGYGGQY